MELITAYDQMVQSARANDGRGFYQAILNFAASGISATKNPVLLQLIDGIMPNLRRLQYVAIALKTDALEENTRYFKAIIDALETRDPEKGVAAIEAYIDAEQSFAIAALKNSALAGYLG